MHRARTRGGAMGSAAIYCVLTLAQGDAEAWDAFPAALGAPVIVPSPQVALEDPVSEIIWGERVTDPYRWLEDLQAPEVRRWVRSENVRTRRSLEAHRDHAAIRGRLAELARTSSPTFSGPIQASGRTFMLETRPGAAGDVLVVVDDVRDSSTLHLVIDPARLDPSLRTSIDFFVPSPDGRYVAVSLSTSGREDGSLHVFDSGSGQRVDGPILGVHSATAGGAVAWNAAGDGFFYTRHPAGGAARERYFHQRVYEHALGHHAEADTLVLGEGFSPIARIALSRSDDGLHHLARVSEGDGNHHAYWLRSDSRGWRLLVPEDGSVDHAAFGADGDLYLLSRRDAPLRRLLRLSMENPSLDAAELVVTERATRIESFAVTREGIYVVESHGGLMRLRAYDRDGRAHDPVDMGRASSLSELTRLSTGGVLVRHQSFTEPPAWYVYSTRRRRPVRTSLVHEPAATFHDTEVRLDAAIADDGTEIPLTILLPKGLVMNGRAPAILEVYGSYGVSFAPSFSAGRRLWLDHGGVVAIAHVRGGGELGEEWHEAGRAEHKRRGVDDLAACARHLVAAGYTDPSRLAVEGRSAGGLLAYALVVHHPDRVAAAVVRAGHADVLRSERTPNGAFNVPELGSIEDVDPFRAMLACSPYHNVFDGAVYPAVLSIAGTEDVRAEPWHALKMTARLLGSGSPNRVLLRVDGRAGHLGNAPLVDRESVRVDVYTFLFRELGVAYRPASGLAVAD